MRKNIILTIILFLVISCTAFAQRGYTSVEYIIGFATGDLGGYVGKTSFRGAVFEYQRSVNTNVTAGFEVGWSTFYERKDYDTYTIDNQALSGVQYRTSNHVPILVSAEYVLKPDNEIKPYVNLGVGTMYSRRDTDMGVWRLREEAWHFALKPEVGLMYEMNLNTSFNLSGKYYTGFASGDLETQSYFALGAGFIFHF